MQKKSNVRKFPDVTMFFHKNPRKEFQPLADAFALLLASSSGSKTIGEKTHKRGCEESVKARQYNKCQPIKVADYAVTCE